MKATGIVLLVLVALTMVGCLDIDVGDVQIPEPPPVNVQGNAGDGSGPSIFVDIGRNASASTLGAENGVLFYAYDVLAYPEQELSLAVRLLSARTLRGLGGVTVAFTQADRRIGDATTDRGGMAVVPVKPAQVGDYTFTAQITAVPANIADDMLDVTPTQLLLIARDVNTKFVVVSVDDSLVTPSLGDLLSGEGALPMDDASSVLSRLADEKDCTVVYVTGRPEQMNGRLKYWLTDHDFPAGPVLTVNLGTSRQADTPGLADLRRAYPGVMIGVGPDIDSARAYLANEMTAFMLPRYDADPDDMRDLAEDIEELPDSPQLNVVNNWREIEVAVFHNIRFTPETYAKRLEKLADEIERQRKRDRRRDDD